MGFGGSDPNFMSSLIDNSYVAFVNLDIRRDRLTRMTTSLQKAGLGSVAQRMPGMLPPEAIAYAGGPKRLEVMLNRTPGAIGCHFSQVKIMKEALLRKKHAFVMEDDLVFCGDFQKRLEHMDGFLFDRDWDVLWLGATFHINPPWWHKELGRDAELTSDPRMVRTFGAFCTYAYIVNAESIPKVLAGLDEILHLSMGIDWAFIQMQPRLACYAFVPGSVIQYDNQSNIGKGVTTFSGFKKLGAYWWADKMTDFDPTTYDWHEARFP